MSRWPDRAARAADWDRDADWHRLGAVGRRVAELRAEYEDAVAPLIAERDELAVDLVARGALVAEVAARAGVSDSLMSRRLKKLRGRARP